MRKAIENTTLMPIFVAGVMIPSGETRHFEDDQIPPEHRDPAPQPEAEPELDPIGELAARNAVTVIAALPDLASDDLARLQLLEFEGKARKTVLEAIAAEGLARATAKLDQTGTGQSADADGASKATADGEAPAGDGEGEKGSGAGEGEQG